MDEEGRRQGKTDADDESGTTALIGKGKKKAGKQSVECYNCGKMGHMAWQCRKKKEEQANYAADDFAF